MSMWLGAPVSRSAVCVKAGTRVPQKSLLLERELVYGGGFHSHPPCFFSASFEASIDAMGAVIFIGIHGSGKSSFYKERFFNERSWRLRRGGMAG